MSILIKNMEMPTTPVLFCIHPDGKVFADLEGEWREYKAVPIPPHFDLIDHNALKIAVMNGDCETRLDFLKHTMDCINHAPVVIPSDMPEENKNE